MNHWKEYFEKNNNPYHEEIRYQAFKSRMLEEMKPNCNDGHQYTLAYDGTRMKSTCIKCGHAKEET